MPAKKVRVHELAKELGVANKDVLDLCAKLGVGASSHSSSIEDAQADRIRRRANADGIVGTNPQEEGAPKAKAAVKKAAPRAKKTVEVDAADSATAIFEEPSAAAVEVLKVVAGNTDSPSIDEEAPAPRRIVSSSRPTTDAAKLPTEPSTAPLNLPGNAAAARPPMPGIGADAEAKDSSSRPPMPGMPGSQPAQRATDSGGRPIPPPPGGRPTSQSGRPIPPPPGGRVFGAPQQGMQQQGGRPGGPAGARGTGAGSGAGSSGERPAFGAGRPGGPARSAGAPGAGAPRGAGGGAGFGAPRTGGFAGPRGAGAPGGAATGGRPGGFGGARASLPGIGGGPGSTGGGVPGAAGRRGGGARPGARRSSGRRRRNQEELEPTKLSAYQRSDAPVPEGEILVERGSTAQEVGPKFGRSASDVIRFLFLQGEMLTPNTALSDEMVELFALDLGVTVKMVDSGMLKEAELAAKYFAEDDDLDETEQLRPRGPVVTVMGHVDHGKTTVLDRIRKANVVAGEAGGITQHIGAYQVEMPDGRQITFIDTPGHEAFTAMRMRGANVTDIVVLVVAADDGVMPQTIEAINHAKAAGVPIIVAINKIDRADADPQRVMTALAEHGLMPEQWGGDTIMVEVSALQNLGLDDLLENILVVADVADLKAVPDGRARGVVLEANLDIGRGPVATVLIQRGTLQIGDAVVAGPASGRVRAIINDRGELIKEAFPSMPVEILGFEDVPFAGDDMRVTDDDRTARTIANTREHHQRVAGMRSSASAFAGKSDGAKLEDIFSAIQQGETATLNLIVKADVQGSLEAVTASLKRLEREKVKLGIVLQAPGAVTQNDVQMAATTGSTIIGFNVRPDRKTREMAAEAGVEIRTYEIIYKLIEDIEAAMVGMLAPEYEEVVTGECEVREVFGVPKIGKIAGCYVRQGVITRGSKVRFLREGTVIWNGSITSLRRFKDDAKEVATGFECGIGLSDFQDLIPGDVIETYELKEIPRT